MLTADHGCDPAFLASTDHTREYVPLLVYFPGIRCGESGTRGFSAVAGTALDMLGLKSEDKGESLLPLFG